MGLLVPSSFLHFLLSKTSGKEEKERKKKDAWRRPTY
jgi:hypothetical protein